jgi:hypothetical protein
MPFSFLITIHRSVKLMTASVLLLTLFQQIHHSLMFWNTSSYYNSRREINFLEKFLHWNNSQESARNRIKDISNDGFGACLMVKEDVELLYEWIAYHYTVLPLRHLVIGSDIGNHQDPSIVLDRWKTSKQSLNLDIHVVDLADILRTANDTTLLTRNVNHTDSQEQAHHSFIQRQKAFVSYCSQLLQGRGVKWTTYIDSDEFVVWNRWSTDDTDQDKSQYSIRNEIPSTLPQYHTVWDVLQRLSQQGILQTPCLTIPRLLVGALENVTCPGALEWIPWSAPSPQNVTSLSTLRYHQHAQKGDFTLSKFGKVIMDLSLIPQSTLASPIRNIHRPYKEDCGPGVVHFPSSLLYLNHYIGSWERYSSRIDGRRSRAEWEKRAYLNQGTSCENDIHAWLPRFIDLVGDSQAHYLLGITDR